VARSAQARRARHQRHDAHDLAEPIRIVRDALHKPVLILDPCGTASSVELRNVSTFYKPIRLGAISVSQFPRELRDAKGAFHRPPSW
jgi:hypothetical protein